MNRSEFLKSTAFLAFGASTISARSADQKVEPRPQKPKSLKRGNTIGITAPSGAIWNKYHIDKVQEILRGEGFKTVLGKTLYMQDGYLAGEDEVRANELMEFYTDDSIDAILTMRGGWGCARILDKLDFKVIAQHPKILMGFSDITSLINAVFSKTNTITFHGPCGYSSWGNFTLDQVKLALAQTQPFVMKNPQEYKDDLKTWSKGIATGRLIGGNLTVIVSMIGTKYEPDWNDKLLFLEEIGEEPYRIDRMLWQLKQAGVFQAINGLIIGSFKNCNPEEPHKSFSLDQVFAMHFKGMKCPVFQGAAIGHIAPKFTVPVGAMAEMDAEKFEIRMLEQCTRM